jgi:hypothetical protein
MLPSGGSALAGAAKDFALTYGRGLGTAALDPFGVDALDDAWHAVAIALALVGVVAWWREGRRSFLAPFLVCYAGLLFVFPSKILRYAFPFVPFFLLALLLGVVRLVALVARRAPGAAKPLAVVLAAVGSLVVVAHVVRAAAEPRVEDLWDSPDAVAVADRIADLAREQPVRVVFFNPRAFALRTGVPAMGVFVAPVDAWRAELAAQRITHVILGDLGTAPRGQESLRAVVLAEPERFPLVTERPGFRVHRVEDAARPGS